jgi:alpha-1,4-digalacturonate transport system substrate-binding protein
MQLRKSLSAALAAVLMSGTAALAGEVRIMWYSDGVEGKVVEEQLKAFEKANPDVKIILDNVSYQIIREQLPVQLEAGRGPDIARVADLKALSKHWLDLRPLVKDASYWETNFADYLDWMRPDGSNAINGYMTQLTLTGGFANKTLFDQAKVPMPGDKATWDEWAAAVKKVQDSQKVPMAMAMDRSGHRFTGPAISMGAKLIGPDGMPAVIDDGFKAMASRLIDWHKTGVMPKEVWGGASGTTYKAANEEFINGQVVMYYSGSWQIPQFAGKIKGAFDWVAIPAPCGPAGCTGMPGGAGLVGIKYTQNPKDVARVMEYLASEPVLKEFYEKTLFLPAHKGIAAKGLDFRTDDKQVKDALNVFVKGTGSINPIALKMQAWRWSSAVFAAVVSRLSQAIAGEMSLDDAYARIDSDVKAKVAEAK